MKNSRLDAKDCVRPGILLLGDAFNMRHPLTGGKKTNQSSRTRLYELIPPSRWNDGGIVGRGGYS